MANTCIHACVHAHAELSLPGAAAALACSGRPRGRRLQAARLCLDASACGPAHQPRRVLPKGTSESCLGALSPKIPSGLPQSTSLKCTAQVPHSTSLKCTAQVPALPSGSLRRITADRELLPAQPRVLAR
eukprot:116966-Chlamydomonas_euryale.AAC.3